MLVFRTRPKSEPGQPGRLVLVAGVFDRAELHRSFQRSLGGADDDLRRVATPELLDQLATNSLALRLDDQSFAEEIYSDIRRQAVEAAERWSDASIAIELTPFEPAERMPSREDTRRAQLEGALVVTIRWEYTVVPQHHQRRFVVTSDREEYSELAGDQGHTSAWYFNPNSLAATSSDAFTLVQFSVDGVERPIRRNERKTGQSFTVSVGHQAVEEGRPVRIVYTTKTLSTPSYPMVFVDIEQPTWGLRVELDYGQTKLAAVNVVDFVPSVNRTHIEHSPGGLPVRSVRVGVDGWTFPKADVAFLWHTPIEH